MGARDRRLQPSAGEKGGAKTGPSPVVRGRAGSKHHLLVDGGGIPLAWTVAGGNRNDVTQLLELLDRVPHVRGRVGRPRRRPRTLIADRGYDYDKYRRLIWKRGVKPIIARRQIEHGSGLGRHRWVVERTFAWLHNRRRLLIRTDRRDDIHEAFLALACCLSAGSSWRTHRARTATSVADLRNCGRLELRTNSRASALDVEAGVLIVAHQSARDCDRAWLSQVPLSDLGFECAL
jgi:transposase